MRGRSTTSLLLAMAAALAVPVAAHADTRAVAISDGADQPCYPHTFCTPDVLGATASYDTTAGTINVSVTFSRTMPGQSDPGVPGQDVRFALMHGVSNGHCGSVLEPDITAGLEQGDVIVRGYVAGEVVNDEWTQANVVIGGVPTFSVPRVLSADGKTLSYTVSNPALVGSDFRCFEVSETVFEPGAPIADATQYQLFPGMQPLAEISGVAAAAITPTSASIASTIDPDGAAATAHLEYGTTTGYGSRTVESSPLPALGPFSAPLTHLKPGTTYHFRVVATNALGTVESADQTFQTVPLATLTHAPRLTGSLKKGSLAACSKGTWSIAVAPSAFRWFRGGAAIAGARAATYRIRASDAGRSLRCEALVSYGHGQTAQARSAARTVPG